MPDPTTTLGIPYPVGTDLVSNGPAEMQALATQVDALLPHLVTSLPVSPVDGQLIDYLADATNGVVWRFRYRSASPSAYKWEFVGGSQIVTGVSGALTTSSTTVVALSGGPSVTVPLGGDYDVVVRASVASLGAGTTSLNVALLAGGSSIGVISALVAQVANDGGLIEGSARELSVAAGAVFSIGVLTTGGISSSFANGQLFLRPARVG